MGSERVILVTGIGGNVGQGILRNIRNSGISAHVVGCNVKQFSGGNHLADRVYKVPYANEEGYIQSISEIIEKEGVQVIVPSTDYEGFILAESRSKLNCEVVASKADVCFAYLDKYRSWLRHKENGIPFAPTVLLDEGVTESWTDMIFKPREGRGSRGVVRNPKDKDALLGLGYVVQPYLKGDELTTAFYVTRAGLLHGYITLKRELENGTTMSCSVIEEYDDQLKEIIDAMIKSGGLAGSVNIQSRLDSAGRVIPFEINCRVSGTNSIRSQFGFQDVKYILQEYLLNQEPERCTITKGTAVRILMDVIYPEHVGSVAGLDARTPHYLY